MKEVAPKLYNNLINEEIFKGINLDENGKTLFYSYFSIIYYILFKRGFS
jgi:hypothetical protein